MSDTKNNPILILIRGLPGSGKSTMARKLLKIHSKSIHIEADMFFQRERDYGEYIFSPSKLSLAHEWCRSCTSDYLSSGHSVIVSNTFTTLKEMKPYLDIASSLDIPVFVFRLTKDYGSIHDVPRETIEKMKNRFESFDNEIIDPLLQKGI